MQDEIQLVLEDAKEQMDKACEHLDYELGKIRAGKANPHILDDVKVEYFGAVTPLSQVANVNTPDPRTIAVRPWEKSLIGPIEKAIMAANLGLTPINDGSLIRICIPVLTEERRKEICKQVRAEAENTKVVIRNIRRDANEMLKKLQKDGLAEDLAKDGEASIQKIIDATIAKVDEKAAAKEADVMKV